MLMLCSTVMSQISRLLIYRWHVGRKKLILIARVLNCLRSGFNSVAVKTVDTDVVRLILAHLSEFDHLYDIEVDFGFGKNRRYYNINKISSKLTSEQRLGLMFYYTFTGCDMTSSFFKITKTAWWKIWSKKYIRY